MRTRGERDPLTISLGQVLAAERRKGGRTQEQLAFECKMHPTTISQLERGINSPTVRVLAVLARRLGLAPSELLSAAERALESDRFEENR